MGAMIPGLYASAPEPLGSGPSLEIRAFLLQREQDNLLVYRSERLEQDVQAVNDRGNIWRQYLTHRPEASPKCDWVASMFDAPRHCHAEEAASVSEACNVAGTFFKRHHLDELDFEMIPVPGHTSGVTAFLWETGQDRCLFTGDAIFFVRDRWRGVVADEVSERERYIESLELIRSLDFDLVAPGIAPRTSPITHWSRRPSVA